LTASIQVAALSDIGCVRSNNEDNFGYDTALDFYVVCDGMGGAEAGEVASSIACSTVIGAFSAQPFETPIGIRLSLAISAANAAVRLSSQEPGHKGMATTMVAAALEGNKLLLGNVGDSRAYLLHDGDFTQVTEDHSYVNELVRLGSIKAEDKHTSELQAMESVITRAIGASQEVNPDIFPVDLHDGDAILLASDGLTRYVQDSRIAELVDPEDLEASCQNLIDEAKSLGGADNITCILLRYNEPVGAPQPPQVPELSIQP
jgi:serine/threonine protein phosphatase PrpC